MPSWMNINYETKIIDLYPSTKTELALVNKIYYVFSI